MTALATLTKSLAARFNVDESNAKELMDALKQTAFKTKDGNITDAQMTALMIVCQQYGLNPWVKEIYAYPDKGSIIPIVSVDGWARMINDNPQFDGLDFSYSEEMLEYKGHQAHAWVECRVYRKDRAHAVAVREYFDEVCRRSNFPTPWDTHPKRMHRHKALIQCARVAFGFGGIFDQDEAESIVGEVFQPVDPVLESIKTMMLEDFKTIDHTVYSAEDKAMLRAAMTARKAEILEVANAPA